MLEIVYTNQFKRDYRRAVRRNEDVEELFLVIDLLAKGQPLPQEKRDHALSGLYAGYRECHVRPDFLLVYKNCGKEAGVDSVSGWNPFGFVLIFSVIPILWQSDSIIIIGF